MQVSFGGKVRNLPRYVRAFEIREADRHMVCHLASELNDKLFELQKDGWIIESVYSTPCLEYDREGYFESTLFTIIAYRKEVV